MIAASAFTASTGESFAVLAAEELDSSSLVKLIVFVLIFVGPAILKSIKESREKRRSVLQREQALEQRPTLELEETEAPAAGVDLAEELEGREQWERLLRGEAPAPRPVAPPPIPAPVLARRQVLTETRPLTEEPALTDVRTAEVALPERSMEVPSVYETPGAQPGRLGEAFGDFAPSAPLSSDKGGRSADLVGSAKSFLGGADFQAFARPIGAGEITSLKSPLDRSGDSLVTTPAREGARIGMRQLRRSVLLAEVIGPPLALRRLESGPTRPLGWS